MRAALRKMTSLQSRQIEAGFGDSSVSFVRIPELHKARECELVAAVCYRVREGIIEFLLVQTRGSQRWTFPKGKAEAGMTHAQAAAMEAFEEAGVHGRIEERSFARYLSRVQSGSKKMRKSSRRSLSVSAHLCEVLRLTSPKESGRNRKWLSAQEAKRKLRESRNHEEGAQFTRIVDQATRRIEKRVRQLQVENTRHVHRLHDELCRVQFEAIAEKHSWISGFRAAHLGPAFRHPGFSRIEEISAQTGSQNDRPADVLPFASVKHLYRSPKLLSAARNLKGPVASTK
jgi:8-oxo-dGTP pyrophosphatase MutT (NUDIX family)